MASFQNGLFGCTSDCGNCFYGLLCPQCALASARTKFDESNWCLNCMCLTGCTAKSIIRDGYGIQGGCCGDILSTCLCFQCTVCQLLNETDARGTLRSALGENTKDWRVGLCSCCDGGCCLCVYSFLLPCCAFARARSNYDDSDYLFNLCCMPPPLIHNILREAHNIKGHCCTDIIYSVCCMPCSAARLMQQVTDTN